MSVQELKQRLDNGAKDMMVIDVREPWELNVCSLPGAVSVPMRAIPARYLELPRDTEIALMCHHGIRSQQVALYLERMGFDKLNNVVGGIAAWARDIDPKMPTY